MFNFIRKHEHGCFFYVLLFFSMVLHTTQAHAGDIVMSCPMLLASATHKTLLNYSLDVGGGERVFVVRSSLVDPDLMAWLKTIKKQNQGIKDPLKIASNVVDHILKEVKTGASETAAYNANPQYIKLGQILKFGGVCRHRALLLLTALEEFGVQANYGWGNVDIILEDGSTIASDFHAWVEVAHKGRRYLFDPTLPEVPKAVDITSSTERYLFTVRINNASRKMSGYMSITPFHFLHDMNTDSNGEIRFTTSIIEEKMTITKSDLKKLLIKKLSYQSR